MTRDWRVSGKSHLKWLLSLSQLHGPKASQHLRFQIEFKAVHHKATKHILTVPDFKILLNFVNSVLTFWPLQNVRLQIPAQTSAVFIPHQQEGPRENAKKVTPALHAHVHENSFAAFVSSTSAPRYTAGFVAQNFRNHGYFPVEAKRIVRSDSWFFLITIS